MGFLLWEFASLLAICNKLEVLLFAHRLWLNWSCFAGKTNIDAFVKCEFRFSWQPLTCAIVLCSDYNSIANKTIHEWTVITCFCQNTKCCNIWINRNLVCFSKTKRAFIFRSTTSISLLSSSFSKFKPSKISDASAPKHLSNEAFLSSFGCFIGRDAIS